MLITIFVPDYDNPLLIIL